MAAVLLLAACEKQRPPLEGGPAKPPETVLVAPHEARALIDHHNGRVAALHRFYADGVVTLRWRDDKGRHEEQADFELWIDAPHRAALRIHKLGEEFLFAGSSERGSWLLDLRRDDETAAYLARPGESLTVDASSPINLDPSALSDLLGLTPLPTDVRVARVSESQTTQSLEAALARGDRLVVVRFNPKAMVPTSVELLVSTREVTFRSEPELESYQSVELDGVAPGAYPKLPRRVRVHDARRRDDEVSLTIGFASGRAADQNDRAFDIDLLLRRFEPKRVTGAMLPPPPFSGPTAPKSPAPKSPASN